MRNSSVSFFIFPNSSLKEQFLQSGQYNLRYNTYSNATNCVACRAGVIWRASAQYLLNKNGSGRQGRKICNKQPTPTPTVHSNSKLNMAGRINDREPIAFARTNKTLALQATNYVTIIAIMSEPYKLLSIFIAGYGSGIIAKYAISI